ncbi:MAG TPA: calcium-binding protein [Tepidisphaeraceae bacterium]|jgi:Ca2+-binding RTX toxin-like protein
MARADEKGTMNGTQIGMYGGSAMGTTKGTAKGRAVMMEPIESRRMMAFNPVGAPGVLLATNAAAVESAAAAPDATDNIRYATVLSDTNELTVVPVAGPNSANPGTPLAVTKPPGSTISNTDVAANVPADLFVVVFQVTTVTAPTPGNPTGGTDSDIYAALYANGAIVGAPFRVNTTVNGNQTDCRVAMDGSGNFTVVWQSSINGAGVVGRRFQSDGTADGGEFIIAAAGVEPDVSANASGASAITYSQPGGRGAGTYARLYNPNGQAGGTPIPISGAIFSEPAIGLANSGRFVVAYATGNGTARRVVVQSYAPTGRLGRQLNASTVATQAQTAPQVQIDNAGNFAVGWAQAAAGTNYNQAAFRVFNINGGAFAPETVITGVRLSADNRFGMAYRIPGLIHIAYATPAGEALMQTYLSDGGGGGGEAAVPGGALLIDLTAQTPGVVLEVQQGNNQILVFTNGVQSTFNLANYTSIYVRGTPGNDFLRLSSGVTLPSIIYARAGGDTVYGGSADDQIDGGEGGTLDTTDPETNIVTSEPIGNSINGRDGNDYVYGGASNDTVYGGGGDDRLLSGPGRNLVYGEEGSDTIIGGSRADALIGGEDNDTITGGDGGDYIDGRQGDDSLDGGDGTDRLDGGNGSDTLSGGLGDDVLHGGRGIDTVFGNDGRDTLFGDAGADRLRGGGVGPNYIDDGSGDIPRLDIYYYDLLDTSEGQSVRIEVP